ncbi:MAG: helix-turn-helix transcriptional regulator [Acidimicrobiia bacterium]
MARQEGSFNSFLKTYEDNLSGEELERYEVKLAQYELANELIELRKAESLTQQALADRTGIGQPEISRIESGQENPTMSTMIRLARGLQVRIGFRDNG